jgi:beta-xylosidase
VNNATQTAIAQLTLPAPVIGGGPAAAATNTPSPACLPPSDSSNVAFSDDFNGSLGSGWTWLGEDASRWSLTAAPGFLRITLSNGTIQADGQPKNFLVRQVPAGNFELQTFVRFEPKSNFQFAGLFVYQNQGNALQFGRAFAQCPYDVCKGNAIYFDLAETGKDNTPNFATAQTDLSQAHLRLRREGTKYSGYYSGDGVNWSLIGEHTSNIAPAYIGLVASQAYEAEADADFDCFRVQNLP